VKLNELFPNRFVRGQDLTSPVLASISAIEKADVHPRPGVTETKLVLRFESIGTDGKPKPLAGIMRTPAGYGVLLRKSLAVQIFEATATSDTDQWSGKTVVLASAPARASGRDVLTVVARAPRVTSSSTTTTQPAQAKAK
jgi:hypothetical protein